MGDKKGFRCGGLAKKRGGGIVFFLAVSKNSISSLASSSFSVEKGQAQKFSVFGRQKSPPG